MQNIRSCYAAAVAADTVNAVFFLSRINIGTCKMNNQIEYCTVHKTDDGIEIKCIDQNDKLCGVQWIQAQRVYI